MDADDIDRIESTHGPLIRWQNGQVGWDCTCGAAWPCRVLQLAEDVRAQRHRVDRDVRLAQPWRPAPTQRRRP